MQKSDKKDQKKDPFLKDIRKHLKEYKPAKHKKRKFYPTMAVISDIHWPFSSQKVINAFYEYVKTNKPKYVIINGDAWDLYSHSKYPRSHNVFTPRDEQTLAREMNETFWKTIKQIHPKAKCYQMLGNHEGRALKRVMESYPESEDWVKKAFKELFTFKGVKTILDPRQELVIDDILIFHGYRSKLGDHRDYTHYSCIWGHSHVGGVVWRTVRQNLLFDANSGYAGDPESKGLSYTPQKITHWTPGFLVVTPYGPMFVPV